MAALRRSRLVDHSLQTRLWLVLAGSDVLDRYRHPGDSSPPLNVTRRKILTDLDYRARRRMAIEPFTQADRLPPEDAMLRELDRLAAGNVWLLTCLLEPLFEAQRPDLLALSEAEEDFLDTHGESVLQRWEQPLEGDGWELYREITTRGIVGADRVYNAKRRASRRVLEYQALVHRLPGGAIELGPAIFRRWSLEREKIDDIFTERHSPVADPALLPPGHYRYDIALSYASTERQLTHALSDLLRKLGFEVFWDVERSHGLWGANLADCLPKIYDREARLCILLVSQEYTEHQWTKVEAKAAATKAIREGWESILIVSIGGQDCWKFPIRSFGLR